MAPAMATYEYEANLDDIPVVDLARCGEEECLQTVRKACEEIGCFRVINHGIAPDVLRNADLVSRDVFSLPTETKTRNVPSTPFSGYIGGIPHVPFYESLGIGLNGAPHTDAIQKFSLLMWPHGNQNFCVVHQIILASLGVGKYYDSQFDHGKAIFRLNMYDHVPPALPTESIYGLPPHTDGNTVTLLYEDREGGGLQVRNKAGNWVEVKAIPNTFVAVMGDSFQAWSNGRIHNAKHQVILKRRQSRLSLGWFSTFPDEMEIKAPPELIDDEHPQIYRAFKYGDMIAYRSGEGLKAEEPLYSFAGIQGK